MCWRKRKKMSTMATSFCESILTKNFLPWESDVGASCIRFKKKKKKGHLQRGKKNYFGGERK